MSFQYRKSFSDFLKLWRDRKKLADRNLSSDLKSFLPPALEILEKPPQPASGWILGIITSIIIVALLWSIFGKVNIISVAEGKIIPSGKVKQIQPYAHGMVSNILVTEGQIVSIDQPLIELDRTQTDADETRLLLEKSIVTKKIERYMALVELLRLPAEESISDELILFHPILNGNTQNGVLLLEQYKSLRFQQHVLESQLNEKLAELDGNQILINQFSTNIPLAKKRLDVLQSLFDKKMVGLTDYMSAEIYYNDQVYGHKAQSKKTEQILSAINTIQNQLTVLNSSILVTTIEELDELTRQLETINQDLIKVQDLSAKQIQYSPVNGTVKDLMINTVGGIVTPAQVLMEIIPLEEKLEVEAFLSNNDIGYVEVGQTAEIKVHTFPFTKYGFINATIAHVAEDATVDENLGLVYRISLILEKNFIIVDGQEKVLVPGMLVSAEISTGKRRIIEFLLAPLIKMKNDSLRER
jgi:hemolysin D